MFCEAATLPERLVTDVTNMRLMIRVDEHVFVEVFTLGEGLATYLTFM